MIRRTIISLLTSVVFAVSALAATGDQQPQGPSRWEQRMKAEKIAFLTTAMELTPQEAQAFWPLYNKAEKESAEAMEAFGKAYVELDKAVRAGKTAKEISVLVTRYVEAEKASRSVDAKYVPQYMKIISAEKVAKLFVGEEDFRRMQMRRYATGRGSNDRNRSNPTENK